LAAEVVEVVAEGEGTAPLFASLSHCSWSHAAARDYLGEMLGGALGGVILRQAIAPALAAAAVHLLRSAPGASGPVVRPGFAGHTYGAVLVVSPPDLKDYLLRGEALTRCLGDAGIELVACFEAALASLSAVPLLRSKTRPVPLTVRVLGAGQGVAVHSERGDCESMRGMEVQLDRQLSCYVPLLLSEGGELEIFHRPPAGREPAIEGLPDDEACARLAAFGATLVRPVVGDLLVFDGGRFNHRVRPTRSERWTAGAFVAAGQSARRLWS
jgi:hypothetical protein